MRRSLPLLTLLAFTAPALAEQPVDYLTQIKPLLTQYCVACHSAEKPRGKLRLDTAAGALKGGTFGPSLVPGQPDESEVYLAVLGEGGTERMPLNRPPLSNSEIDLLRRWIAQGAPSPDSEIPGVSNDQHWAFTPPVSPSLPTVHRTDWARNPIDLFIFQQLASNHLSPSPEADRATLIRRLSLDVIGLPPSPEEVAAFVADPDPNAYDRLVDQLLASPHYGERWGRWWLDMARYADSNGYSIDAPRDIWKYRDWVIDAFNRDLPFDQFTIEQLAGDLLPNATLDQKVATGFHRNTQINQEGGIDPEQFRFEAVIDRVNTTGTVWLGLTIACAQCHDHKYDPISQREYYQLFAFLNSTDEITLPVATPDLIAQREAVDAEIDSYLATIERDPALLALQKTWETTLDMAGRQKQSQEVRKSFDTPFDDRPADENRVVFAAFLDQSDAPEVKPHRDQLSQIRKAQPRIPTTLAFRERAKPRPSFIMAGGDFTRPSEPVSPGIPSILPKMSDDDHNGLDRLDLAKWLVRSDNPLTARVTVNRIWQVYFGRGLVETDEDLGTQGTPPSHPELLDWLATQFIEDGWSLKSIHRLILTSATYRQASVITPELQTADPDNRKLARQSRLRLHAELLRDSALVASGLFTPTVGGPSVFPPQPDGVMTLGQMRREWKADSGPDRYRRALYTYFWRATPHPMLTGFDAPDSTRTCTRRPRSNTPLQALMLLNDASIQEFAHALSRRILKEGPDSVDDRIRFAFHLTLCREPNDFEQHRIIELLNAERTALAHLEPATADFETWTTVARVLLNLDEFLTRE